MIEKKLKDLILNLNPEGSYKCVSEEEADKLVAEIKQAFQEKGYRHYAPSPEEEQMIATIKSRASNYMTGQEWYERFEKELHSDTLVKYGFSTHLGKDFYEHDDILEAARNASGIKGSN